MTETPAAPADVQRMIDRSPFLSWLGLRVRTLAPRTIELEAAWREEWVANPDYGQTQGGILAALIDFAASYALFSDIRRPAITIDLRIDYHRTATKGDLTIKGEVIKLGRQFSVSEARILDRGGRLIASGRGSFLTAAS